jgi:hypothetical protein
MEALMCLTVDTTVPPHVLDHIAQAIDARRVRFLDLPV